MSSGSINEDSSGNVGIGDSSPDNNLKLDVEGKAGATAFCDENGNNCIKVSDLVNLMSTANSNHGSQTFNNSGTFTVPAGVNRVSVTLCGGGGGGGGAYDLSGDTGFAGGGGHAAICHFETNIDAVTPGENISIIIGNGGSAGATNNNGVAGTGGISYFGSYLTALGGAGAKTSTSGSALGGIGAYHRNGYNGQGSTTYFGGKAGVITDGSEGTAGGSGGGSSLLGGGGNGGNGNILSAGAGDAGGVGAGGGGGGLGGRDGAEFLNRGGAGGKGICIVYW